MTHDRDLPSTEDTDIEHEAIEARRIILARRARYIAMALAATGVATNACGGNTDAPSNTGGSLGAETGGTHPCLTATGGTYACLSAPMGGAFGTGGATIVSESGGALGTGGANSGGGGAHTGGFSVCLSIVSGGSINQPYSGGTSGLGGMTSCLAATGGVPPAPYGGGTTSAGGSRLAGGMTACLSIVPNETGGITELAGGAAGTVSYGGMSVCLEPPMESGGGTVGSGGGAVAGTAGAIAGSADVDVGGAGASSTAGASGTAGTGPGSIGGQGAMGPCLSPPMPGGATSELGDDKDPPKAPHGRAETAVAAVDAVAAVRETARS